MRTKLAHLTYAVLAIALVLTLVAFHDQLARLDFGLLSGSFPELLCVTFLALCSYLIRSYRWLWMLRKLGYPLPVGFAHITYFAGFAFTLAPGKVGELAKCMYYRGFSKTRVTTAYTIERAIDLVVFICLASFLTATLANQYYWTIWIPGAVVSTGLVILVMFPYRRLQSWQDHLPRSLTAHGGNMVATARTLLSWRGTTFQLAMGVLAWGSEAATLYVLSSLSSTVTIGLTDAIGIYAVAMIVGAISFLPGGLGTTEATLVALLTAIGFPVSEALLITVTCRFVTLWFAIALGWGAVVLLRLRGYSDAVAAKSIGNPPAKAG